MVCVANDWVAEAVVGDRGVYGLERLRASAGVDLQKGAAMVWEGGVSPPG